MAPEKFFEEWPRVLAKDIEGETTVRYRMERLLSRGIVGHTDFSGKRCAETALHMALEGVRESGMVSLKEDCLEWWRCSDMDRLCVQLCTDSPRPAKHVYGAVLDRVPLELQKELIKLRPNKDAPAKKRAEAYVEQAAFMRSNNFNCFSNREIMGTCLKHPVQTRFDWQGCCPHKTNVPEISLAVAGTMCTPFSSQGKKEGLSSRHTESFQLWACEMRANQYDVITHENSPFFPEAELEKSLGDGYESVVAVFGPENMGWPCRRKRKLMTCFRRDKFVWAGPAKDMVMAEFGRIFFKETYGSGDYFVQVQDSAQEAALRCRLAHSRGLKLKPEEIMDIPLRTLLSPFQKNDFDKYEAAFQESAAQKPGCTFIVDLSQSFERKRISDFVPTILKNTQLYSFSSGKFFTASAVEASQGMPSSSGRYAACRATDTTRLAHSQRMQLSGNGMHLPTLAAWHLFIFGNLVRREESLPAALQDPPPRKRLRLSRSSRGLSSHFDYQEVGLSRGRTFDYQEEDARGQLNPS